MTTPPPLLATSRFVVLHVCDCPNVDVLIERVRAAVAPLIASITTREIDTDTEAVSVGMHGSPTLLINDVNYFTSELPSSISCTLHLPTIDEIRAHLPRS